MKPRRLIYDKAADSDALRLRLKKRGIELICPHRSNRKRPMLQDGRSLRRYRRRWTIERTVAWLGNFRRLVVRYEQVQDIPGFPEGRLPDDHPSTVLKPVLVKPRACDITIKDFHVKRYRCQVLTIDAPSLSG
jgi:hypothetical protein